MTFNILTSDWEVTTFSKGNPFDQRNKAVCCGFKSNDFPATCSFTTFIPPTGVTLYVFFNAKFDCHWYRKCGVDVSSWKIWCCQIGEFLLSGQKERYPSLENTAVKYGLGHKIDVIKEQYWDKSIDTDAIPPEVLSEYCCQDVNLTYAIYLKQKEQLEERPMLYKLFKLMCQDLLVLEEMEWNGLLYDEGLCHERARSINIEIEQISRKLAAVYSDVGINFASNDQLSAFLYGGGIPYESIEHIGFYKGGQKAGQPKYKKTMLLAELPRLVEPLKGSELKKENVYATDEATLRKLKGANARKYVGPLLRLAELEKLNNTYYLGLPKKNQESHWPNRMIHGQFNQVVAQTGRLSSSAPNLQNFSSDCLDIFVSRYDS